MRRTALFIVMALTACSAQIPTDKQIDTESQTRAIKTHPFVGCWQSEDGLATEGWTQDPSGWLFGYAVNRDPSNQVTFFEQMRIDDDGLVVIGPNDDPTRFQQVKAGPEWVFENPEHDYPQRITYNPSMQDGVEKRLDAEISLMDGSQKVTFLKSACE